MVSFIFAARQIVSLETAEIMSLLTDKGCYLLRAISHLQALFIFLL